MSFDERLAARVRKVLGKRRDVVETHMFGGLCFMVNGAMCCGLTSKDFMVRVVPDRFKDAIARPHARPMDFTANDEVGTQIEGFDAKPVILENSHQSYVKDLVEANGFTKAMDLLMWHLEMGKLAKGLEFHPAIMEAAQKSLDEHGITIRSMRKSDMQAEVMRFHSVYNEAWGDNWGFVPITEDEAGYHAKLLKQIIDEDWAMIAETENGTVVGAALTLPDMNQVLAKMDGRLFPTGWLKFLRGKSKVDVVRILALGVTKAYQHTGVAAALYVRHIQTCRPDGVMTGAAGWILETNEPMNRALEGMGGVVNKKFRVYEKTL